MKPVRTSYLIRRAQLLVYANLMDCLGQYNLTPIQYMTLNLSRRGGQMSSADLARRLSITPQSVNEMVAVLHRKKLVERKAATENRRILRISLTPEGQKLLRKCDHNVDLMERRLFATLSPTELGKLRAALRKLLEPQNNND